MLRNHFIEKRRILLLMILFHAVICIGITMIGKPLHTTTDELGALVSSAKIAGLDWSGVIQNCGYYGFGWYWSFFWVFKITDNPFVIYQIIRVLTAILRIAIVPIAYYISNNLFHNDEKDSQILAFVAPMLCYSGLGNLSNDIALETFFWILLLILCQFIHEEEMHKRFMLSGAILVISMYTLTIHTRALVPCIAIAILMVFFSFFYKRYGLLFLVVLSVIFKYIIEKFIAIYQLEVWNNGGDKLRNATVIVKMPMNLFDPITWNVWLDMVLGMLSSEQMITCGVFAISEIVIVFFLYGIIFQRKKINVDYFVFFVVPIMCIGAVILSLLFSGWATSMYDVWEKKDVNVYYAFKSLCNVRYWGVFASPLLFASLSWLFNHVEKMRIVLRYSLAIMIFNTIFFSFVIIPLVNRNSDAASLFAGITGYKRGDNLDNNYYYCLVLIGLAISVFVGFLLYIEKKQYAIIALTILLCCEMYNKTFNYDLDVRGKVFAGIDASYKMKEVIENSNITIGDIYINESSDKDNNWKIYAVAQFYFNRYKVVDMIPENIKENDIIISTYEDSNILKKYKGITEYKMDNNEYWYTFLSI